jgi:Cu(I)/Ag(I) efflux system protein CusF
MAATSIDSRSPINAAEEGSHIMKTRNKFTLATAAALVSLFAASVDAQTSVDQGKAGGAKMDQATASPEMADGEIRKVDKDTKKITIKHGEIKNLEMPGMTMLFQVKDPAMLDMVKPGDKVKFKAEKAGGAIVVTEIQVAK